MKNTFLRKVNFNNSNIFKVNISRKLAYHTTIQKLDRFKKKVRIFYLIGQSQRASDSFFFLNIKLIYKIE